MDHGINDKWLEINGFHVKYSDMEGYTAYNDDNLIFQITSDGMTKIRTRDGHDVIFDNLKIEDIKPNSVFKSIDGMDYYFSSDAITSARGYNDEIGGFCECQFNDDNAIYEIYDQEGGRHLYDLTNYNDNTSVVKDYSDGITRYYNDIGNPYCIEKPDGSKEYFEVDEVIVTTSHDSDKKILITYPDGTYIADGEKGTYVIDTYGMIVCDDGHGNKIIYDKFGNKYQTIDAGDQIINFDKKTGAQIVTKDGKTRYSKMNHIEYDEEAYTKVLNTLNGIDGSSVISKCTSIEGAISNFPDSYSSGGINSVKGSIEGHVNLIKSLSEMTNYSLLAYQICDEELRDGLYLLVDSLFGDNEVALASRFKNDIKSSIEDRDNDKILEFKEIVNFKVLSENVIVKDIYIDDNGNKWYLNKNNRVIGIKGDNIKLDYGGETFNLSYDENGVIKLVDSKNNPIDILGDYNLESVQYGGNQEDLIKTDNNQYVEAVFERYFPNTLSLEEKYFVLLTASNSSCGHTLMTNLVFKKFEGNEAGFYKTFGYPMYDIVKTKDGLSVDYNYEPLIMDLYCAATPNPYNMPNDSLMYSLINAGHGTMVDDVIVMEKYLKDRYNVSLDGYDKTLKLYGEHGYTLYNMDGSPYGVDNSLGGIIGHNISKSGYDAYHGMLGVGETSDGRPIVSTWGRKLILELSTDPEDIEYGKEYYREYN